MFNLEIPINILWIPTLGKLCGENVDVHSALAEGDTTIKSGATKSHFSWYHVKHKPHFIHSYIQIPELYLYVGHGWSNALCMHIHKLIGDKLHYDFSSAYSVDPNIDAAVPPNPHVIPYEEVYMDEYDTLRQRYCT